MIGIYAGSFDILTYGHIDVLNRAGLLFEEIHVLIANNPDKKYLFTAEERLTMFKSYVNTETSNCKVTIWDRLVIDYDGYKGRGCLVRGIRNPKDMVEEMILADINQEIGGYPTIFIPCKNETRNYSSSLVKELLKYGKDISQYVPPSVCRFIKGNGCPEWWKCENRQCYDCGT